MGFGDDFDPVRGDGKLFGRSGPLHFTVLTFMSGSSCWFIYSCLFSTAFQNIPFSSSRSKSGTIRKVGR